MKKSLLVLFFLQVMGFHFICAQSITFEDVKKVTDDYAVWTSKTRDVAYEAPNSSLIKKWYVPYTKAQIYGSHIYDEELNIEFFNNGTFVLHAKDGLHDYKHEYLLPGTWKRNHDKLTLTYNFSQTKFLDKLDDLSMRVKEDWKKSQAVYKKQKPFSWTCTILRMDDHLILDEFWYYIRQFSKSQFYDYENYNFKFVSEEGIKEYIAKEEAKKKKEEEAKKKEEEKRIKAEKERQLTDELEKVNAQAYSYMHEGKYDEAVAAINTAIEKQPDNPNWYDSKGEILYMKGDKEGAKAMWDKVISLDSNFPNSVLRILMTNKGWIPVNENFPYYIPFKKIRVLNQSWGQWSYCCAFFNSKPDNRPKKEDTNIAVNFFSKKIIFESLSTKYKNCTDVGNGWVEYEFSKYVYFSHYQQNAPKDRLMILIE